MTSTFSIEPGPTATPPPEVPLTFYGGAASALVPFLVFLGGVTTLALAGAPDERGFWPVLLGALIVGLLLAKDRTRYADAMLDGMSQRIVMIMICAWLFAGVLGTLLSGSGFVGALAWGARVLQLSGGGYVAAAFLACALVATATGTSFGTILVAGPLLYPAGGAAGADPAALIGAILAGATFGDSISPVSDTTIASSGTQEADIGGTVKRRLRYALPAGLVALVASAWLGGRDAVPVQGALAPVAGGPMPLVMLVVPAVVIAILLARRHLVEALLFGILGAVVTGVVFGLLTPGQLLRVEPGSFGATGLVVDGLQRGVGVSVFTLLLMALVGTLQATDLLDRLVRAAAGRARSARGAEGWIVATVSGAVMLTTHSVVAVLVTGPFAKQTGARFGISRYRRANLLDLTVCTWPFLLPWFLPPILAASTTASAEAYGMPAVGAGAVGIHNTYAWALVVMVLVAVGSGYGRGARVEPN
jgi:Na+/H+ antiporter NhaC